MAASPAGSARLKVKFTKRAPAKIQGDVKTIKQKTTGSKRKADDEDTTLATSTSSARAHQNITKKKRGDTEPPKAITPKPTTIETKNLPESPQTPSTSRGDPSKAATDEESLQSSSPATDDSLPSDLLEPLPPLFAQGHKLAFGEQFDDFWNGDAWLDPEERFDSEEEREFQQMVDYEWMYCNEGLGPEDVIDFDF